MSKLTCLTGQVANSEVAICLYFLTHIFHFPFPYTLQHRALLFNFCPVLCGTWRCKFTGLTDLPQRSRQ